MRVLICDQVDATGIDILRRAGVAVDYKPGISSEELLEVVGNYDALVVRSRTKVTRGVIERGQKLKVIVRAGVGLDNIDVEYAKKRGIEVLNTPEAPTNAVAELTIGLMIALARKISLADQTMKRGLWLKSELMGVELCGKTLSILGLGRIGSRVAELATAFGMRVLFYSKVYNKEFAARLGLEEVSLEDALRKADFVSIHLPLTGETRHLIDGERLALMKQTAYLINTARGAIVDARALYRALKERRIAGAALDVYEVEPPTSLELIRLPNVVCTPHIGAQTREAQRRASEMAATRLLEALRRLSKS